MTTFEHSNTLPTKNIMIDELLDSLTKWLSKSHIGKTDVKRLTIAQEMFWSAYRHGVHKTDIEQLSSELDKDFTFNEGNLFVHMGEFFDRHKMDVSKLVPFCQDISNLTPIGLNTSPNACCGKNELLYRLFRPKSSQPSRGDILDDNKIFELKGQEVRIQDPRLSGLDYCIKTNQLFIHTSIQGNQTTTAKWKHQTVFEIEKPKHKEHYEIQFNADIDTARDLISKYFKIHEWDLTDTDLDRMFKDRHWHQDEMQKIILKNLFTAYKKETGFDKMIIFGDRTNVKIIETVDDMDKLEIYSDYFRIGQKANVGFYIR